MGFLVEDVIRFAFIAFTVICVICIAVGLKGKKIPHATLLGHTTMGNASDPLPLDLVYNEKGEWVFTRNPDFDQRSDTSPRSESVKVSDDNTVKNADGNTRSDNSSDFLSDVLSGKYSGASKDSKETSAVFRIGLVSFILAVLTMAILIFRFFR